MRPRPTSAQRQATQACTSSMGARRVQATTSSNCCVVGGVDGAGARGARVVHQRCHVVLGSHLGRAFAGGGLVGQVALVRGEQRVAPGGQHVIEVDHGPALGQHGFGNRTANAVAGAGNDGDGVRVSATLTPAR